jgi:hypothetical protein
MLGPFAPFRYHLTGFQEELGYLPFVSGLRLIITTYLRCAARAALLREAYFMPGRSPSMGPAKAGPIIFKEL